MNKKKTFLNKKLPLSSTAKTVVKPTGNMSIDKQSQHLMFSFFPINQLVQWQYFSHLQTVLKKRLLQHSHMICF